MVSVEAVESIQSSVSTSENITDSKQQAEFIAGDHREQFLAQQPRLTPTKLEEIAKQIMAVDAPLSSRTEEDKFDKIAKLLEGLNEEQIQEVYRLSNDMDGSIVNSIMILNVLKEGFQNPAKTDEPVQYEDSAVFSQGNSGTMTITRDEVLETIEYLDNQVEGDKAQITYGGGVWGIRNRVTEVTYDPSNGNISISVYGNNDPDKSSSSDATQAEATLNKDGSWSAPSAYDAKQIGEVIDTLSSR